MDFKVTSRFVVLWICCVPYSTFAQQDEITSRHYSMKDGLSNDGAMCLLQDSKGFLWVGTYSGLNKFDGYHFTSYLENPDDPNSLINNHVECLWEDDQQRLWIGTEAGLQLFDLTTEKFHHLRTDSLDPAKGFTIDILKIRILKIRERKDGKVWICTAQGIYLADPQTLFITKVNFIEDGHQVLKDSVYGNTFWDIAEANDGTLWAATEEGLLHIDLHNRQTKRYLHDSRDPKSLTSDIVKTVYIDRHDRIWAGANQGLDLFNPQDQSFTHFVPGQSNIEVHAIFENPDGKFWIGFHPGLYAFDPDTGKFGALMHQNIWSIIRDRQGIMWIASAHGLFQITPGKNKFIYSRQFGATSVSDVRVFAEDKDHHIWIAVHNSDHQLFRYDPSSRKFFQYQYDPLDPYSFSGNSIRGIIPDKDGGVWLTSYRKLHKFNSQDQTFLNIALPFEPTTLLKDSKGKIWLGKWAGVEVYDPQSNKHEPLINFPRTEVTSVVEDREENIWIGTIDGLCRYSLKTGQLDVFKHNPADPQSISHNRIEHLMIDQEGTMWLGTFGGLNKMVPGTGEPKFRHWRTTNSHLPHDLVFGVIDGGDGTLWMSCGNRISHFFPQSGDFRNYDHSDGLYGHLIFKGLRSHRGEIYFSSRDGLIAFHPDSLKDNLYLPAVAITGFYIHNEPVSVVGSYGDTLSWKTPLAHTITYTDEVAVTHLQNDLTFEFAALNYIKQEKNQYKYKLEPYEKKWIETSADNRIARYTNLSPGRYTFHVIGSNNDGAWNQEGATLVIVIAPPWWKTWWAYSLYAIVAIVIFFSLRRYDINRVVLKHRAEQLSELDTLKTRFFANISHEFRTPITLILGPLKDLYDHSTSYDQRTLFGTMLRNAQRLLRLVNQLLDLSRLEAGKMKLHASGTDLVQFLKEIAASYESLATDKKIKFFFYPEVQDLVMYLDAEKMEKVVHNLLSNAFKFTREGGEIILNLKAGENESIIIVKDTGIGISAGQLDKVFDRFYQVDSSQTRSYEGSGLGMALAKELVELHHGTISLESIEGRGSTFTVRLPLGKEHLRKDELTDTGVNGKIKATSEELITAEDTFGPENGTEITVTPSLHLPVLLIVEDNADMRHYIRKTMADQYQIMEAEDGKAGVSLALESVPDLIISDIMMPEMDGYKLCELIKTNELTSHIPIILLTAKADRESKLTGLETGADDYLSKPFDADELKLIVRNRIEERRKMRERFSREMILRPRQIAITSLDEKFLAKVLAIIEKNMDNELFSIDELSREVGYSNMHFYRKIKALAGQQPSQFVRTIRLKRAAELLAKNSDNVSQIAYSVGFSSLSYFNKCFKEQFGVTPGKYADTSRLQL
jgi:signal transduction histidine kinase/ligand-binding sensor domain-containing protein/DNA-binding response OmpR family regulator